MRRTRGNKNKRRGKRGNVNNRNNKGENYAKDLVLRGMPMPRRITTPLTFNKQVLMNNVGFAYTNVRFNASNAYDVDPVLGSTSVPFFTEFGGFYRRYRVHKMTCIADFLSNDTTGGTVCVCPVNADPTANVSPQQYLSNPLARRQMIASAAGGAPKRVVCVASPQMFGGSSDTKSDDTYSALVNAGPSNGIWFFVGFYCSYGALTNGISVNVCIKMQTSFYELTTPPG
jgi:hypothetical protein